MMDGTLERIVYFGFAIWIIAELRAVKGVVAGIKDVVPVVLSPSQMQQLHESTFAILDRDGHPVGCGFFVTACGVALTAAHASRFARLVGGSRRLRASNYRMEEFELVVVNPKLGDLDVAVLLRITATRGSSPPQEFLPLPTQTLTHLDLVGAPVALIHSSIAWRAPSIQADRVAKDHGYIITTSDTLLQYDVSTYKGHSGAALLFRRGSVIGLHVGGFNDLDQGYSERSPSTTAEAVRMDLPRIWAAVKAAKAAPAVMLAVESRGGRKRASSTLAGGH